MENIIDTHTLIFNTKGVLLDDIANALDQIFDFSKQDLKKHLVESIIKTDHEIVFTGSYDDCLKYKKISSDCNVACYIREIGHDVIELNDIFVN
jgi:hypothetical protein